MQVDFKVDTFPFRLRTSYEVYMSAVSKVAVFHANHSQPQNMRTIRRLARQVVPDLPEVIREAGSAANSELDQWRDISAWEQAYDHYNSIVKQWHMFYGAVPYLNYSIAKRYFNHYVWHLYPLAMVRSYEFS